MTSIQTPYKQGDSTLPQHTTTRVALPSSVRVGGNTETQNGMFWETIPGKLIRWLVFLPIAFILTGIIEALTHGFFTWLFDDDMRMLVIVGILFGGFITLLPVAAMLYHAAIVLANQCVCPSPRIGVIIFATLYIIGNVAPTTMIFTSDYSPANVVTLSLVKAVFLITALCSVTHVYSEGKP